MTNFVERICDHCGATYTNVYTTKSGHSYQVETKYCSKSCAGKACRPSVDAELLRTKALDFIRSKNSHCSLEELCAGLGHSSKTFYKHGLSIPELNTEAGYVKPKSKFQGSVGEVLKRNFIVVEEEKTFDGLVGVKGHPLRVDFYLPEIDAVVEADGSQHSDPKHPWKEWNNGTVAEYDKIKEEYLSDKGIKLVRIPYTKKVSEIKILSSILS